MSLLIKKILLNNQVQDVLIEQGKIARIAPKISHEAGRIISGDNRALLPAYVNGHTHSAMTLLRGYGDDMPLFPWLQDKIWPAEARYDEEAFYWGYRLAFLEMIQSGTCFFNDMYFHGETALQALKDSGLKGAINYVFLNPTGADQPSQWRACESWFDHISGNPIAAFSGLAPHSIYTVPEDTLRWIARFSKQRNLKVHIHLSETEQENLDCQKAHGMSPTALLHKLDLLTPRLSVAHGLWLSDEDIQMLSDNSVTLVHNPASNMKLASGPALDFQKLSDAGVPIILGTDGASSNNNLDMADEMKLACLLQKQHYGDSTRLSAHQAFEMATRAGARFWNTGGGEIKEGASADLMVVRLDLPEMTPCHDLISNLVYSASSRVVDSLIVNGEIVMDGGEVKDSREIMERAARCAGRITSQ